MPKLIDYPRTSYTGAWELAEIVDDTGGKCAIETAARKLDRKVSGSFKAIIGSAVKFNLITSKRELLSTTTLFKRIKHAYDKQEELVFHREAFLSPPLFTQICRKFRSRELPVQMLDVMLIREFGVEEINAAGVAKAFVDGCRMVGLLDEHNIMADIDALANQRPPRRELASPPLLSQTHNLGTATVSPSAQIDKREAETASKDESSEEYGKSIKTHQAATELGFKGNAGDAIANLFGFISENIATSTLDDNQDGHSEHLPAPAKESTSPLLSSTITAATVEPAENPPNPSGLLPSPLSASVQPISEFHIHIVGPGLNTQLAITDTDDINLAIALLEKIRRQLKST